MGTRRCKLDHHDFTGIFLGYTLMDQNILYLDLDSSIVKLCHHAIFDKAWYMQPTRSPTAQLLYDLGLEMHVVSAPSQASITADQAKIPCAPWPPLLPHCLPSDLPWVCPPLSLHALLPLRVTPGPVTFGACAACVKSLTLSKKEITAEVVCEYSIGTNNMAMVYISPDLFYGAFEEELNLCKFDLSNHDTAGLNLLEKNRWLFLTSMAPSTPGAQVPRWRTRLRGAYWLIAINGNQVSTINAARAAFCAMSHANSTRRTANEPRRLGDQSRRTGWIRSRITSRVVERLCSN